MIDLTLDNIFPQGNRLLIDPFKAAKETTEGLEMVEGDGYATPSVGTIIRVGDGLTYPYKVGDVVMMRRYSVDSIKVLTSDGEKEIYLLEASEVIAVVRGEVGPPEKERVGDYSAINEKQDDERSKKISNEKENEGKESEQG